MPQGVKSNNLTKPLNNYSAGTSGNTASSFSTQFQNYSGPQLMANNQNTSIDSNTVSYRQQIPVPTFISNQKMQINPNSKVGYSPNIMNNQVKPVNVVPPVSTMNPYQPVQNPAQWRKN